MVGGGWWVGANALTWVVGTIAAAWWWSGVGARELQPSPASQLERQTASKQTQVHTHDLYAGDALMPHGQGKNVLGAVREDSKYQIET